MVASRVTVLCAQRRGHPGLAHFESGSAVDWDCDSWSGRVSGLGLCHGAVATSLLRLASGGMVIFLAKEASSHAPSWLLVNSARGDGASQVREIFCVEEVTKNAGGMGVTVSALEGRGMGSCGGVEIVCSQQLP